MSEETKGRKKTPGSDDNLQQQISSSFPVPTPSFLASEPSLYFATLEVQFKAFRISSSLMQFTYAVSGLPPEVARDVRELIENPPDEQPYEKLKDLVAFCMKMRETFRFLDFFRDQDLGTDMPSSLMSRFKKHETPNLSPQTYVDNLARFYFLEKLPASISRKLEHETSCSLHQLGLMADDLYVKSPEYAIVKQKKSIVAKTENDSLHERISSLQQSIDTLSYIIHDLKISPRHSRSNSKNRDRSFSGNRSQTPDRISNGSSFSQNRSQTPSRINNNNDYPCYYHTTFDKFAYTCEACSWQTPDRISNGSSFSQNRSQTPSRINNNNDYPCDHRTLEKLTFICEGCPWRR